MSRANFACEEGLGSTIANRNGAFWSLVSLPAAANTINTIAMVRTVTWTVAGLTIKTCETLVTVACQWANTQSMSRAVVWACRLIAVLALVPICAVGAVVPSKVSSAMANTRGLHANTTGASTVVRADGFGTVVTIEPLVADACTIAHARPSCGTIIRATSSTTISTIGKYVTLTAPGEQANTSLGAVVWTNRDTTILSLPAQVASTDTGAHTVTMVVTVL